MHLRIVHLIDLDKVGGVESLYAEFIHAPAPAGLTVEHITVADSPDPAPRFARQVKEDSRFVSWRTLGGLKLPRRPHVLRAWNRLWQIRRFKPDLVLVWNQFTDFRLKKVDLGCPVIYYEHGMSWYTHHPRQLTGFFPVVSAAIAVSWAGARMLQLKHGVTFPVTVCPNPVRPGLAAGGEMPRTGMEGQRIRLGFAGRLVALKAAGLLILAAALLREQGLDVVVEIAGEGPERGVLEVLVARLGLEDQVHFLGLVDDMAAFYRSIDIFVMTSMHETMPLVCIEAMAHGVPVVCSAVDGFPEVVEHGVTGWCLEPSLSVEHYARQTGAGTGFASQVYDPDRDALVETRMLDPQAIADAVLSLYRQPGVYAGMSQAALARASSGFVFNAWLDEFYAILAEAAGKPLRSTKEA